MSKHVPLCPPSTPAGDADLAAPPGEARATDGIVPIRVMPDAARHEAEVLAYLQSLCERRDAAQADPFSDLAWATGTS
ncbi:hypothetical protein [Ramlibacter sp.]|uniref:hypothetical protein n=1 Tax=Ramlibacter sp. TaxID=1917967 RepID=UPI002BB852E9|nr:hypothetical protein [Ramlibacter sp.]HWI82303.1 hypothetical protein [Ramlibacter sp.]